MDLDEIVPDLAQMERTPGGALTQASYNAAMNVLSVRRGCLERISGKRIAQGEMKRHEAEAEECAHRLETEPNLSAFKRKELQGRMEMALARAEYCQELIRQYDWEITVLYNGLE